MALPTPTPTPVPTDRREMRSHAWVPPVVALLLLLWVLATLWGGAGRGNVARHTGSGGGVGGVSSGAGGAGGGGGPGVDQDAGRAALGAGAGASWVGAAADPRPQAPTPDAVGDAGAPSATAPTSSSAIQSTSVTEPERRQRLGFSSDLRAVSPGAVPVSASAETGAARAGGAARFFGQAGRGTRFVYVIDRSSSMRGERFDAASFEIIKSIRSLNPRESFQVVFYSNDFLVMPRPALLRATPGNKQRAVDWIRTVETGGGTDPSGALQHTLSKLRPTTIWLLSDGSFSDETAALIRRLNPGAKVQINTIAFYSRGGEALLKTIADENQGDYRHVGP